MSRIILLDSGPLGLITNPNDSKVIIATTNVKHLEMFADARLWRDIK